METILYEKEVNGEFTGIYAQMEDGKLTIVEQEMGELEQEYSRDGEIESFVFFDEVNTQKLMKVGNVKDECGLLNILKRNFKKFGSQIKSKICDFCDENGIRYQTQVYY